MADNVQITAGSGTTIATDDAGAGGHVQLVKLAIATDGSATAIPAEATNGLDVDVTRVIPGTTATALGKAEDAAHSDGDTGVALLGVRNYTGAGTDGDYSVLSVDAVGVLRTRLHRDLVRVQVPSSGITTATTAYSAGDQVGTLFTVANAARAAGGTGRLVGITLLDDNDVIGPYDVVLFRASVTLAADNAAFAISDAAAASLIAVVPLSGAWDLGNNRLAQAHSLSVPYDCSGGTSLYAALITRAGHTFFAAADDLTLTVHLERD